MAVESTLSHSYYYDDMDSIELDIRAAEQAHRINSGLADHLLGQEPFVEGASDFDIRRILSVIACTGFMNDPVVVKNFRGLQSRLLKDGDINEKITVDANESYEIGIRKRRSKYRSTFTNNPLGGTLTWFEHAECLGMGTSLFFRDDALGQAKAKSLCQKCQVRAECAEYGKFETSGIWGGEVKKAVRYGKHKKTT